MATDTEVVEKAKGVLAKIVLAVIVAPISLASMGWLFLTVMSTSESVAVIQRGQEMIVAELKNNTRAILDSNHDNADEHRILAEMVYSLTANVEANHIRVDSVKEDCDEHKNGGH